MLNWHKFPDNKPIAFKNHFVTLDISREVIEAYYVSITDRWVYPHNFETSVGGSVIAWAENIRGYNGD